MNSASTMRISNTSSHSTLRAAIASMVIGCGTALAAEVTFFSYSDTHYGADGGGKRPPIVRSEKVPIINALPGTDYPPEIGGMVDVPRGILMPGDLINDGAVKDKYPTQWESDDQQQGHRVGGCSDPIPYGRSPDLRLADQVYRVCPTPGRWRAF